MASQIKNEHLSALLRENFVVSVYCGCSHNADTSYIRAVNWIIKTELPVLVIPHNPYFGFFLRFHNYTLGENRAGP